MWAAKDSSWVLARRSCCRPPAAGKIAKMACEAAVAGFSQMATSKTFSCLLYSTSSCCTLDATPSASGDGCAFGLFCSGTSGRRHSSSCFLGASSHLCLLLPSTIGMSVIPLCVYKSLNAKKEDARKTLAKHVNEKNRFCDPNNLRFVDWLAASNRFLCARCGLTASNRITHECPGPPGLPLPPAPGLPPPSPSSPPLSDVEEAKVVTPTCVLPGLMEILATSIPSVKRVPQQCRVAIAKVFTTIMRNCSVVGTKEQEMRAWKLQFMFPKCVLRLQPTFEEARRRS